MPKDTLIKRVLSIGGSVALFVSLIGGIFALDSRYATSQQVKAVEQNTISTMGEFKKSVQVQTLTDRYERLSDQQRQVNILLKKYPNDQELKEDLTDIKKEKETVKKKLEEINSVK